MPKTPVEILRDAKQLLLDEGWTQETSYDPKTGAFCATGAIARAGRNHNPFVEGTFTPENLTVYDAENFFYAVTGDDAVGFNDAPDRTLDEVLAKFDEAIAMAEASTNA